MKVWPRKLLVPETNTTKEVEAVQLWEVEWRGRVGPYHSDLRREIEVFTSEEDATHFRDALTAAFKLLRHTSDTQVTMRKRI